MLCEHEDAVISRMGDMFCSTCNTMGRAIISSTETAVNMVMPLKKKPQIVQAQLGSFSGTVYDPKTKQIIGECKHLNKVQQYLNINGTEFEVWCTDCGETIERSENKSFLSPIDNSTKSDTVEAVHECETIQRLSELYRENYDEIRRTTRTTSARKGTTSPGF